MAVPNVMDQQYESAFIRRVRVFSWNERMPNDPGHDVVVFGIDNHFQISNFLRRSQVGDDMLVTLVRNVLLEFGFMNEDCRALYEDDNPRSEDFMSFSYWKDLVTFNNRDFSNPNFSLDLFNSVVPALFDEDRTVFLADQLNCILNNCYSHVPSIPNVARLVIFVELHRTNEVIIDVNTFPLYQGMRITPANYAMVNALHIIDGAAELPPLAEIYRPDLYLTQALASNPTSKLITSMHRLNSQHLKTDPTPSLGDEVSSDESLVSTDWSIVGFIRARLLPLYMNAEAVSNLLDDREVGLVSFPSDPFNPIDPNTSNPVPFFKLIPPSIPPYYSENCSICSLNYADSSLHPMAILCCNHCFHSHCISKNVEEYEQYTCPLCRHAFIFHVDL